MFLELSKKPQEKKFRVEMSGKSHVFKVIYKVEKKSQEGAVISAKLKAPTAMSGRASTFEAQVQLNELEYSDYKYKALVDFDQSEVRQEDLVIWSVLLQQITAIIEDIFGSHNKFFSKIDFVIRQQFIELEAEDIEFGLDEENDDEDEETKPSRPEQELLPDHLELAQKKIVAEMLVMAGYLPMWENNSDTPFLLEYRSVEPK